MSNGTNKYIENDFFRLKIIEERNQTTEKIEVKEEDDWIPILSSDGLGTLKFYKEKKMYSKSIKYFGKEKNKLKYELKDNECSIRLEIENKDFLHFKYRISFHRKVKLSKLIAKYSILLGKDPDFTWVPHLRPNKKNIIPDHVFRSPVIIYKKGKYTISLIPDLNKLKDNRVNETIMDFHLKIDDKEQKPYLFYGYGNYKPTGHILFNHNPKKKMKFKSNLELSFGYFLKVYKDNSVLDILKDINHFLWETYGKPLMRRALDPQILPYDINVQEGLRAIFERHKSWAVFKINGNPCGGVFQNTWMGRRKKKYKYVSPDKIKNHKSENISQIAGQESLWGKIIMHFSNSPFWINIFDKFTRNIPIIKRTAEIWNNAWFLNLRTAYGFRYFGELWQDDDLIDKSKRMVNTLINLPTKIGVFPSVIFPESPNANKISTINGLEAFNYVDDYHLVDTGLTLYWALKIYQDFWKNNEILRLAKDFSDLLFEIQLDNGAIPTYINVDEKNRPIIKDILIDSASSGAILMFLTEYYKISKNEKLIESAEKIAEYLRKEIIPLDKWHDFEPFFSCTHLPFDFYDENTKSHCMNTLCIYWNAAGLFELYRITKDVKFLDLAERVLSILSLFQQVWDMPYISFNTIGGFASQNEDAELSDARQALFVRVYMNFYLETGRKEYMERAIATLRACWTLQLLPEYKNQSPGNIKGITTVDGIDKGCVCENYGHSGHDIRVPGYIMFDWGVGSSITATAYTKKHFGDIFIDFQEKIVWGICGIKIEKYNFKNNKLTIEYQSISGKEYCLIKGRKSPNEGIELILNGKSLGLKKKQILEVGFRYKFP
ncbi:MAG: hypothetical protein GF329_15500 [Candidatus Lokiarchaeota archaeon]|nr:hypothetical protein [Candidatus Lokiarchaeota archaeon]